MQGKIFDVGYIFHVLPILLEQVPFTLFLTLLSLIAGLIVAFGLTFLSLSQNKFLRSLVTGYIAFMRGTPPLLLLLLVYYGLPQLFMLVQININNWYKSAFAILAFALGMAAFFSEAMRSAYLAVDKGQREAAQSVGMSPGQTLVRIIIPQAIAISIPNMGNLFISLFKETSFVYSIGIIDVFQKAQSIAANGFGVRQLETFLALSLIYWLICIIIEQLIGWYERRHRIMIP
ncbi:MAG: amino acid ABC transporter permease [Sporolactobacillus sp.]